MSFLQHQEAIKYLRRATANRKGKGTGIRTGKIGVEFDLLIGKGQCKRQELTSHEQATDLGYQNFVLNSSSSSP